MSTEDIEKQVKDIAKRIARLGKTLEGSSLSDTHVGKVFDYVGAKITGHKTAALASRGGVGEFSIADLDTMKTPPTDLIARRGERLARDARLSEADDNGVDFIEE